MSIFSFAESYSDPRFNPYDVSKYIDRVSCPTDLAIGPVLNWT